MNKIIKACVATCTLMFGMLFGTAANAGIPTIDLASVGAALQQVAAWGQQYQQMVQQYQQMAQQYQQQIQQYQSLNGSRNMGSIANDPALRQYIPANYQSILSGGYGNSQQIFDSLNVGVTPQSTGSSKAFAASAQQASINRAIGEAGYKAANDRFSQIQILLDKVNDSPDAKDMADLSGRIQAEQVMMQNESNKIAMLAQLAQAQRDLNEIQGRKQSIDALSSPPTIRY